MQRSKLLFPVSLAALALVALTGCASGDDAPEATPAATQAEDAATAPAETAPAEDAPPTLEGEGISYGAESITGIDFNVTCTGSGADLTLSALGNDAEGNNYVVSYGGGEFSYVSSASDMVSNALSLTAGPSAAGTDVTVEAGDGSHTFTGNGALATVDQPMPETVPFVANLTCDTTI